MDEIEIIIDKYNKLRSAQLKASKKWMENNKTKVNEYAKHYYDKHKDDDDFKTKHSQKAKDYYHRMKQNPEWLQNRNEKRKLNRNKNNTAVE